MKNTKRNCYLPNPYITPGLQAVSNVAWLVFLLLVGFAMGVAFLEMIGRGPL